MRDPRRHAPVQCNGSTRQRDRVLHSGRTNWSGRTNAIDVNPNTGWRSSKWRVGRKWIVRRMSVLFGSRSRNRPAIDVVADGARE